MTPTPCKAEPELWWSTSPTDEKTAVAHCRQCPLMADCAQQALDRREKHGVWGGLTRKDRTRLHRRKRRNRNYECGTEQAFLAHRYYRETCTPCVEAHDARVAEQRRADLAEIHASPEGGSAVGFNKHRQLGEPACEACQVERRAVDRRTRALKAEARNAPATALAA
ncbi:WhiB family transcriptional regulator [Streptomyces sp. NPDC059076]|uniref:WhiB family transcriptional regulator n=1 Tax=unclassified Streptomyces TaxID=2593676 RepID=UPI0036C668DB